MRLLLDTAVLIFAVESPQRLSKRLTRILENTENVLELSAVSISEIAIKTAMGKLRISAAAVRQAVEDMDIRILPYTADHALQLFDLPLHHSDPFDRQIIAQALSENIPIVTCDEKFSLYKGIKVIWRQLANPAARGISRLSQKAMSQKQIDTDVSTALVSCLL